MAKTMKKTLLWLVMITAIFGCSEPPPRSILSSLQDPEKMAADESDKQAPEKLQLKDRKIINIGEVRFECSDINDTRKQINSTIEKYRGYVSKENTHSYAGRIMQTIIIRVPAENFDKLTAEISTGVKKLDSKHIETQDVTEEYLDVEVRIKIKKETEDRYRKLLTQAKTIQEILSIEKQIGELRTEIESIEGRLKYLKNRISYSTLTVIFYQEISTPVDFSSKFKEGLKNGWNGFVWFLVGLINMWPFLLVVLVISGLVTYRIKRKTKAAGPADSTNDKKNDDGSDTG